MILRYQHDSLNQLVTVLFINWKLVVEKLWLWNNTRLCFRMKLKFTLRFFFSIILITAQISNSLDIKCEDEFRITDSHKCIITKLKNIQPVDVLVIKDLENPNEITFLNILNGLSIKTFPSEILDQLPSLKYVSFYNVCMENFSKESLEKGINLEAINLSENKIKKVRSNVFSSLPKLDRVWLTRNEIDDLEEYAFNSSTVTTINLVGNELKTIKKNVFFNATRLVEISISSNLIEEIEEGTFDLPNLKKLDLQYNRLKILPTDFLKNARKTEFLNLRSNQLTGMAVTSLGNANSLTELDVSNNPTFCTANCLLLSQLQMLRILNLYNTGLVFMTDKNLNSSPNLAVLNISQNNLTDSRLLHHLNELKGLRIIIARNNNFTKLDDLNKLHSILPHVNIIELEGNPWDSEWKNATLNLCQQRLHVCCYFGTFSDCPGPNFIH